MERGGAGPGGLGDQARLVQRHGPGVAVRGICQYTIRGGQVQRRRVVYVPRRREGTKVEVFGKWYFLVVALVLSFMCVVLVVVCVVIGTVASEMNARIPTPTPAAEPASWGVGIHQLAGDPRPFELIM